MTQLREFGGGGFLQSVYQNSLYTALSTVYPDLKLVPWLFEKAPSKFWKDKENHKKYFDWLSEQLQIKQWNTG